MWFMEFCRRLGLHPQIGRKFSMFDSLIQRLNVFDLCPGRRISFCCEILPRVFSVELASNDEFAASAALTAFADVVRLRSS